MAQRQYGYWEESQEPGSEDGAGSLRFGGS